MFKSPEANKLLQSLAQPQAQIFEDLAALKQKVVKVLNAQFREGDEPMCLYQTDTYLVMKCKYVNCSFQQWFVRCTSVETSDDGRGSSRISYSRTISQYHSLDAHLSGTIKDNINYL